MIDSRLDSTCNVEQDQINKPANHSKAHIMHSNRPSLDSNVTIATKEQGLLLTAPLLYGNSSIIARSGRAAKTRNPTS